MESTKRLSLPLIMPGQAQKEISHNEALQVLDTLVAAAVEDVATDEPPAAPSTGQCYILGNSPSGEWSAYPGHLAAYTSVGWRFIAPTDGLQVLVKTTGTFAVYGSAGWETGVVRGSRLLVNNEQVVGERAAAIAEPAGGTTIDAEVRSALGLVLGALRHHGLIYS